jgi:uncharacterized protein (TIGR02300 family)
LAKTDLGDKQICPSCGARFYDLRRRPAICPKCSVAFDPKEESVRVRRGRSRISAHDPAYDEDEESAEVAAKRPAGEDDEEEEVEEAVEVDVAAEAEVVVVDEGDDAEPAGDELPEGFSEGEADLETDAADDDSVPLLEDEEGFSEDEIGELPAEDDDEEGRR